MTTAANRIAWLEQQIAQAKSVAEAGTAGDNLSLSERIARSSWQTHIGELQQELRLAKEALSSELVELRLFGGQVNYGSVPLRLMAKVVDKLNNAVSSAAFFLRYGKDPARGVPDELADELDLRLSGLAPGSSRILVSGRIAPDTTGESILDDALHHVFRILDPESPEALREELAIIGAKAVREVAGLLECLEKEKIGAGLTWYSPAAKEYKWGGTLTDVQTSHSRLARIATLEPMQVNLQGEVSALSQSGAFHIRPPGEDRRIKVRYPKGLYQGVSQLHLGQQIEIAVTKFTHIDELSGEERASYTLVSILKLIG